MTAFQAGAGFGDDRPEEARGPAATVLGHSDPASKRITSSRFRDCFLFLHEHGNLACYWDVSDDPEGGDDGDIQYGLYKLEGGVPTSLIKVWTGDKYTGDIGDP